MSGYWRSLGRSWRICVPTIVGVAAVQAALTAWSAGWPAGIALTASLSFLAMTGGAALIAAAVAAAASAVRPERWNGALAVTAVVAVLVVSAMGLPGQAWSLIALPPAAIALAAAAAPARGAIFAPFRHHPVAAAVAVLGTVLVGVLVWAAALLLAFFVTGALGSGLTWLITGVAATMTLAWWSVLRRPPKR